MATHPSILDRETPWTEEPGRLLYVDLQSWTCLSTHTHTHTHTRTHAHTHTHTLLNITGYHPEVLNFLSVSTLIISLEYYKLYKCQCQTLDMIQYSYKMTMECLST